MLNRFSIAIIAILVVPQATRADGFKLMLEDNKIVGKNTEGTTPDYLFGHNFDLTNNVDGTYESSHGSVDANDAGSGFHFPAGGPNDSFVYNIQGLWTYGGGVATPASPGMILDILKASNGAPLAQIDGPIATPQSFSIAATSSHELIWSVSQSSTADVWGLVYTISGSSVASGLPFEESEPLVTVQWTANFQGDTNAAMQAINAAAVAADPLFGDYNGNEVVDAADYTVWRDAVTAASATLLNDPTPGTVDESDFLYWRDHYGESLGSPSSAGASPSPIAVPEPASAWLGAIAAVFMLACGTRQKLSDRRR